MSLNHEELRDLVAAYAVDALEGDEVAGWSRTTCGIAPGAARS